MLAELSILGTRLTTEFGKASLNTYYHAAQRKAPFFQT